MEIKWIKLSVGLATDSKIRYIRMRKNGDQMALLWVLLLCRAGAVNDGGRVYVAPGRERCAGAVRAVGNDRAGSLRTGHRAME